MDPFEFVVSLYAVLAGLGVALLCRSIGQIIESRSRISLYWVHSCWLGFILLAHINSWFMMWSYRDVPTWTAGGILLLLSSPTVLYLASHAGAPEIPEGEHGERRYDMRSYYYERHRLIMGLLGVSVLLNLLCEHLFADRLVRSTDNLMRLVILTALIAGMASRHPRVQAAVTLSIAATILLIIGLVDHRIQ